jgi:outer membrane protein OmpA-like peptidoglycan-associated protein
MSDRLQHDARYGSKQRRNGARSIAMVLASLVMLGPAFAQAPPVHFDNDLTETEMIDRLAGTGASSPLQEKQQLKFRRIIVSPDPSAVPQEGNWPAVPSRPALQLKVNFAFNSAEMNGDGRKSAVGYGRSRLADPAHPTAEVNRRVEIVKAGG